jgi:hypothetical protein
MARKRWSAVSKKERRAHAMKMGELRQRKRERATEP